MGAQSEAVVGSSAYCNPTCRLSLLPRLSVCCKLGDGAPCYRAFESSPALPAPIVHPCTTTTSSTPCAACSHARPAAAGDRRVLSKFVVLLDSLKLEPRHYPVVVGNVEELGAWDATKGVKLMRQVGRQGPWPGGFTLLDNVWPPAAKSEASRHAKSSCYLRSLGHAGVAACGMPYEILGCRSVDSWMFGCIPQVGGYWTRRAELPLYSDIQAKVGPAAVWLSWQPARPPSALCARLPACQPRVHF